MRGPGSTPAGTGRAQCDSAGRSGARANTFFALLPPPPVRDAVAALQNRLAQALPGSVRPVMPINFHVTLVFLGAVPATAFDGLGTVAERLVMPRCGLELDRLGAFGPARVGWLGCSGLPGSLADFREALAASLAAAGHAIDARPWVPHLTLYRKLRTPLPRLDFEPIVWRCDDFALLRTEPGRKGPIYREIGRWAAASRDGLPGSS